MLNNPTEYTINNNNNNNNSNSNNNSDNNNKKEVLKNMNRRHGRGLKRTLSEVIIEENNFSADALTPGGSPFITLKEKEERRKQQQKEQKESQYRRRPSKKRVVNSVFSVSNENNKIVGTTNLRRLASTSTADILNQQAIFNRRKPSNTNRLVKHIIQTTKGNNPWDCIDFFRSPTFVDDFIKICHCCNAIFKREKRVLELQSPLYVLGDIHGNLNDLRFFSNTLWPLGLNLMGGGALFMGDYVDRGLQSVEVICYLFARKVKYPKKIHLLRGNHETQEINTWIQAYKQRSFLWQCVKLFGVNNGRRLCLEINKTFEHMPFGATIDNEIFCVHGGIPKPEEALSKRGITNRIAQINEIPCPINVVSPGTYNYDSEDDDLNENSSYDSEDEQDPEELKDLEMFNTAADNNFDANNNNKTTTAITTVDTKVNNFMESSGSSSSNNDYNNNNNDGNNNNHSSLLHSKKLQKYYQRLAFNLLWADPATDDQERQLQGNDLEFMTGRRGEYSLVYGTKAVETFLKETGLSMIFRAHEATQGGVKLCKHAQVMTIFSTSKNHGQGNGASCACVFVDLEKIYVINKSVAGDMSRSFSNLMDEDDEDIYDSAEDVDDNDFSSTNDGGYKDLDKMEKVEEGEEEGDDNDDDEEGKDLQCTEQLL